MTSAVDQHPPTAAASRPPGDLLEAILRNLRDGVIAQDGERSIRYLNSAAVRALGFVSEAEAMSELRGSPQQVSGAHDAQLQLSFLDREGNEIPFAQSPLGRAARLDPYEELHATVVNSKSGTRWSGRFSGACLPVSGGKLFITTMQEAALPARSPSTAVDPRLAIIDEAAKRVLAAEDPTVLLDRLYVRLADLLHVEFYFHFRKFDDDKLRLASYRGISPETAEAVEVLKFGEAVCGTVAACKEPIVLEDVQARDDAMTEFIRRLGITAYASHPLTAHGQLIGTLSFGTRRRSRFTPEDIALIKTICDYVTIALEQERARAAISDREERLRVALDAGRMGTFDWDLRTNKVKADEALQRMFGMEPDAVREIDDFCRITHPDDVPRLRTLMEQQLQASDKTFADAEFRIVRPNGEIRWIATHVGVTRDADGQPIRYSGMNLDITARKQFEEAQRLAHLAGQVGTFQWDIENSRIAFDEGLLLIYGVGADNLTTTFEHWLKRVHRQDQARIRDAIQAAFAKGLPTFQCEFRIVRPGGEVRWIESRLSVTYQTNGSPGHCYGVNVDITLRRQAEQALRESESRFRRLSESGIVGIAFYDASGVIREANDRFLGMIGYSRDELKRGVVRWDTVTPPEWMARTRAAADEFQRTGRISPYEKEYLRRDGMRFWGLFGGARLDETKNGIAFVLDITEHKRVQEELHRSENRFRHAFEHAPIGMVLNDLQGRFLYVNRAYCDIVGYEPHELMRPDMNFRRLTHPDDMTTNEDALKKLIAGDIPAFFLEKRYLRKDGYTVWVRVSATVHRDPQGRPTQITGLVEDITQRRLAEQALQEADRRKDDFLAALGHELRNPLAPIRNAMHMLRLKSGGEPQIHWAAEVTERQVQQMTRLVDDLLDVSRINRGKIELRRDVLDLADVIRGSIEMTSPLFERRHHQVDLQLPQTPVHVRGDPARLTQVICNLLSNAAKFTPAPGVIEVALEADGDIATIRVRDNGIGISPSELRDIFEPFRQINPGGSQDQAGLGLGLALVKRLIQLHDGRVEVASGGSGKGSEFRIRLPLVKETLAQTPAGEHAPRERADKLRIVVVDDNRDVAESLVALLGMLGHEAHAAFTGNGALEAVERLRPDIVFCDIGLPDVSGHEVAARLRENPDLSPRLIAMTGFARDSEKAMRSGFDEWFLKPVDIRQIESALQRSRNAIPHNIN